MKKIPFEKWAIVELKKIQKKLLLEDFYPIEIKYRTENHESYAECRVAYPYKSITIKYGDAALHDFKEKKYEDIVDALTHEMCHPITDPLYVKGVSRWASRQEIEDERERLTDHIANIILKNGL